MTFLVLEEETLDKLEKDLRDIVEDLKLQAPHNAGLIKESFSYVRSFPKQGIYRDPLPKRKVKKSALSGRVGIGAEERRTTITLNIKDTPKKQPCIEEELASKDGALYDSDFQPFIDLKRPDEEKEEKKLNSDLIKESPIEKQIYLTEKDNQKMKF